MPDAVEETFGRNHAAAGRFRPDLLRKLPPRTLPAQFYFQLVSISLFVFSPVVFLDWWVTQNFYLVTEFKLKCNKVTRRVLANSGNGGTGRHGWPRDEPLTHIMELIIPSAANSARPLHPNYIQILISTKKSLFEST